MTLVEAYLYGALAVAGFLVTWFKSELPVQVFRILHDLGWKKNSPGFWPQDIEYWLRHEWATWCALSLPGRIATLLNCSYCLSWHIAFWVSLVLVVFAGQPWWFVLLAVPGWVYVSNLALLKVASS